MNQALAGKLEKVSDMIRETVWELEREELVVVADYLALVARGIARGDEQYAEHELDDLHRYVTLYQEQRFLRRQWKWLNKRFEENEFSTLNDSTSYAIRKALREVKPRVEYLLECNAPFGLRADAFESLFAQLKDIANKIEPEAQEVVEG